MKRTQIYLDENVFTYFEAQSKLERRTVSDLIRQALEWYLKSDQNRLVNQAEKVFGIWRDRDFSSGKVHVNSKRERYPW